MDNAAIAAAFEELAERMAVVESSPYRFLAYRKAATTIGDSPFSVALLAREGRLRELPGVGEAIARKIADLVETGTFRALERARSEVPDGLLQLTRVDGIGKTTAVKIWGALGAESFDDVLAAVANGDLLRIPGVGAKTIDQLVAAAPVVTAARGQDAVDTPGPLLLRDSIDEIATLVTRLLVEALPDLQHVHVVGDHARGAELASGLELLLVAATPLESLAAACELLHTMGWRTLELQTGRDNPPDWVHTLLAAPHGIEVGLFVCDAPSEPRAFLAAMGPPAHATAVEQLLGSVTAPSDLEPPVDAATPDVRIYDRAGLAYAPPELRDRAEAALPNAGLPAPLVQLADLRSELHCHSTWSDGRRSIFEMARAAIEQGDSHMAITDHSAPFAMVGGLDEPRLAEQAREIDAVNAELAGAFEVLRGSEVEVLPDGTLGVDDEALAQLDWVVASIHTSQRQDQKSIDARIEAVLRNPLVDCIGHPTSRLLLKRGPTRLNVARMIEVAAETGTVLEINANPRRLDLSAEHARAALDAGVLLAINSDAHGASTLPLRTHGVSVARRAGATPERVVNTFTREQLEAIRPRNR